MFVYVNGRFIEAAEAFVSVQDRGFRFGDGAFETIRLHGGAPFQWDFHRRRLQNGLDAIRIAADAEALAAPAGELIRRNGMREGMLRIAVSRGAGGRGYLPAPGAAPTVVMETREPPPPPAGPLSLWLSSWRKIPAASLPAHAKLAQGMNATLARLEAEENHAEEALQLNTPGEICEASGANILWLSEETLHTPALECGVLPGSTRHALLARSPWPVREGRYPLQALERAEAVALTSVALGAAPVQALLPQGLRWRSESFAARLQSVLQDAMARSTV